MCGIAGFFEATLPTAEYPDVLRHLGDAIHHRGPDQSGALAVPELAAGLTARRLSLVDLDGGRQPISNEDDSVHVVFNGEIYNHRELRESLKSRGHRFRTRCDTEVIVHLYEDLGLECLDRLHGMFALAILDERRRKLVLARDGAGMKNLYWARTQSGLFFASEIKSLLASGLVKPEPDVAALQAFVFAGFVPAPRTGFSGIQKLPPGGWLVAEDGRTESGRFWLPTFETSSVQRSERDYAEELEGLLRESVRSHVAADVPVGAFLSGGWDSSLVASYAAEFAPGRLKTFSIVFPDDPGADESRYSRRMAEHLGSDHREIEFRSSDIPEQLPNVMRHLEEPMTRAPIVLCHQLASLAATEVKSVVSGEGSDELFAGYAWFRSRDFTLGEQLRRFVPGSWAERLPELPFGRHWDGMRAALRARDQEALDLEWMRRLNRGSRNLLHSDVYAVGWQPASLLPDPGVLASCRDRLQRRLAMEFSGRLSDSILLETDKLTMAHSLEGRMPFLHRPVIEFALSLPSKFKLRRGREKYLLRRLVRNLPPEIANRRKQGLWYDSGFTEHPEVRRFVRETLLESTTQAPFLVDRRSMERQLDACAAGGMPMHGFWAFATLQCWWNEFFGHPPSHWRTFART